MTMGLWEDALDDAKQACHFPLVPCIHSMENYQIIALDPSSPWSHERILTEWTKVNLMNGLWKGALLAARDVGIVPANVYP